MVYPNVLMLRAASSTDGAGGCEALEQEKMLLTVSSNLII